MAPGAHLSLWITELCSMGSWVLELLGGWGNIVNGYSGLSCASPTIYPPGM